MASALWAFRHQIRVPSAASACKSPYARGSESLSFVLPLALQYSTPKMFEARSVDASASVTAHTAFEVQGTRLYRACTPTRP
jgi:hypothetical protein